jgi:hypothetical protein
MKQYEDLQLNYDELAYITDVDSKKAKEIMCDTLGKDKVSKKDVAPVFQLRKFYGVTASHDERYDKINKLVFDLNMKAENYKNCLNEAGLIKKVAFTGGKTIFNKILTDEQKEHAISQLKMKHIHLYGKESYESLGA